MKEVDFYECSRAVEDRFVGSMRGEGEPRPLLAIRGKTPREVFMGAGVAGLGLVALSAIIELGLGDLSSNLALHPPAAIAAYAVAVATIAFGVLTMLARMRADWALPFQPGIYLFPSGVIDARRHIMRVFTLSRLVKPSVNDNSLALEFPEGETFRFPVSGKGHTDEIRAAIEKAQADLEEAQAAGDRHSLGVLDPLLDVGVANPFAPKTKLKKQVPFWARQVALSAVAVGVVLAPGVWFLRNWMSDAAMLNRAHLQKSAEGYRAYLGRGGRQREVADVLLPRAELVDAVKEGTVDAVERYIAAHPNSKIGSEVSDALRQTMLVELETTKRAGTVSALNDFARRHPNKLVDAEIKQAIHAVYQAAFAKYKKESAAKDPAAIGFVERLLAFAEKGNPRIEVRFHRKTAKSGEIADNQVKKSPYFMGTVSLPSQYFDEPHSKPREAATGKAIVARFAGAFAPDILSVEMGAPITDPDAALPATSLPTLFIEHTAELSGASYLSANPRGVFVGLGMMFEVTFKIPDDAKPLKFKLTQWRPPDVTLSRGDADSWETVIYEAMATESFNQFTQRYLAQFFSKGEAKPASDAAP
jgi:hypothetical protein